MQCALAENHGDIVVKTPRRKLHSLDERLDGRTDIPRKNNLG